MPVTTPNWPTLEYPSSGGQRGPPGTSPHPRPPLLSRPRQGASSLLHPLPPRPHKPSSSVSHLRRRRVRCKRCEACLRTECGDCNYCRDMRKFGGPGRLKQTCVLRQCLAPGLPLSAVCAVCGEGSQDADETQVTLMECSSCAQITHPDCLKVPREGVVNKDLPSCWECPKCVLDKGSTSESSSSDSSSGSSSDDDSAGSARSPSPAIPPAAKRSHREEWDELGEVAEEEGGVAKLSRRGRSPMPLASLSQPRSRRLAPPPSQDLLLQQQQNRRRAGALELRLRKRIKMEREKISPSKRKCTSLDSCSPKLRRQQQGQDRESSGFGGIIGVRGRRSPHHLRGSPRRLLRSRGGVWRGGPGSRLAITSPSPLGASSRMAGMSVRNGRRERGRGVRLRGGGRAVQQCRAEREEEENDEEEEEGEVVKKEREREDGQRRGRLDKENRPHRRRGRVREKEREDEEGEGEEEDESEVGKGRNRGEEAEGDGNGEGEERNRVEPDPVLLVSDVSEEPVNGSYLTVTLQRLPKAKRDPGAIVPKLEAAVAPRAAPGPGSGYIQRKTLQRPQKIKNGSSAPLPQAQRLPGVHDPSTHPRARVERRGAPETHARQDRKTQSSRPSTSSSSSSSSMPAVTPPFDHSLPLLRDGGNEPGCEKEVWVSVFRYLTRAELCLCMTVCKSWYKWSCDKRLWTRIDLSRCPSISPQALSGIIKRQPVSLDLSWTSISKKQLTWLINRLPGLKDLMVSGCSWSSVSALSSPSCPLLRTLDLCWTEGVKDIQIRDLLTPPGSDNRSKLRNLQSFRLAGLEISDSTLRLIIRHMPLLARLDLSQCRGVTDQSINLLTAVGSSTRNTLTEINLAGCSKLTDICLLYLKRLSSLSLLDLRGCKYVTRQACESFISELSVNALYCLSEDKLIQRIS
ncbi:hypothetical protein AGOR_G00182680 [Albula goreensis]|uniref:Lysine-specific demethylase 2A-like n=1 Tax=Albula goreensis TaxID=1534307 RepID=A0A8T3CVX9_9TELE|nr:hypothetical protein AGOR_G00182680 [Albula goreensis]